jgi:DNA modification methylase
MSVNPIEIQEYLRRMIDPEDRVPGGSVVLVSKPSAESTPWDWYQYPDASVHGVVMLHKGWDQSDINQAHRVLKPGGHLLLMNPEDPVGDQSCCYAEDIGFEVRDAILVLDKPEGFQYTAKASRSEREAGAGVLKSWEEESDSGVNNNHPTVKPVEIMEFCLRDVPREGLVVDPFLGSGTTLLAAVNTGHHNAMGIEREVEYAKISTARVQGALSKLWNRPGLESDVLDDIATQRKELSLDDLFGWDS